MRGSLREVKEVVFEGTGCDWAVSPTGIGELGYNDVNVEDETLPGTYGHSDAVADMG